MGMASIWEYTVGRDEIPFINLCLIWVPSTDPRNFDFLQSGRLVFYQPTKLIPEYLINSIIHEIKMVDGGGSGLLT